MISEPESFEREVDQWLIKAISGGISEFSSILETLPGVYPPLVLKSISRNFSKGLIRREILDNALEYTRNHKPKNIVHSDDIEGMPVPHPLDYSWRFNKRALAHLLKYGHQLSKLNDVIVFLGIPSLQSQEIPLDRRLILIDKNLEDKRNSTRRLAFYKCDLLTDSLPKVNSQVVIADPPWYPEYMLAFMWAAANMCNLGGYILFSIPPLGTRPNVKHDIDLLLKWSSRLGLNYLGSERAALAYVSPFFERNALRANGFTVVPTEWRRADLITFQKVRHGRVKRPINRSQDCWTQISIDNMIIKTRNYSGRSSSTFRDPSLVSIVPGDILPTVSSRDSNRRKAKVWTSGNRIFDCNGVTILVRILNAISQGLDPLDEVSKMIKRKLEPNESEKILSVAERIIDIIETEKKEMLELLYGK